MTFATAAPLFPSRLLSSRNLAIPNRTDNEPYRKAVIFAKALCRPHMNASTSSFPLTCWTHRRRIATSHSCHLLVKNRAVGPQFPHLDGGPCRNRSITLACKMVKLKGMSLHTGSGTSLTRAVCTFRLRVAYHRGRRFVTLLFGTAAI